MRAFFRNGGRRCWIIRIAGAPETNLFPLPGLVQVRGDELLPAFARARSAGSGFDRFRAATALAARSVEVLWWSPDFTTLDLRLTPREALRTGDLIRLTFAAEKAQGFFLVGSVEPLLASPPEARGQRFAVRVQPLGWLTSAHEEQTPHDSFEIIWMRLPDVPVATAGHVVSSPASPPVADAGRMIFEVGPGFAPPPGSLVRVAWPVGEPLWVHVEEMQFDGESGSPPGRGARLIGRAFRWSEKAPNLGTGLEPPLGEKLTFELRVRRGENDATRLIDLGFAPAHPRFWSALPADAELFAANDFREAIEQAKADAHEALWREASEPRFPLAGDRDGGTFIPLAMSALAEPSLAPQHRGGSALERDGLADFSSALFLDSRLLEPSAVTLPGEADFIRYQTPDSAPLTGLHAALDLEEATLIAVPDAMHRGWREAGKQPVPPPVPSQPREHPAWWHALACDPPESPPYEAREPERGHFLECALRVLAAPFLENPAPDASGAFTLNWSSPDADVVFILEEAVEPDFADAIELHRGTQTSHTALARPAGNFYYRVRAEAGGESSNWSNEVVVPIASGRVWQVEPAADFQPDALLDIHRALLRICAARGDLLAVLSLPEHFREDDALNYLGRLKSQRDFSGGVLPLNAGEAHAFSYAAVYHPWLIVREESAGLRTTPPDGAATGIVARRSLARGAWIAPANELFSGVVALTPRVDPRRHLDLLLAQLNLVRQEPAGFLALNADTLSDEPDLRPINVRRLLILLRRAALRLGMTYVFEPNDGTLRRVVQGAFESLLGRLFARGAFAGDTPESAYQVVTNDTVNPPQSVERGRFFVDLKVAPALPMSFLTVRLVQIGERATATELF